MWLGPSEDHRIFILPKCPSVLHPLPVIDVWGAHRPQVIFFLPHLQPDMQLRPVYSAGMWQAALSATLASYSSGVHAAGCSAIKYHADNARELWQW